MKLYISMIYHYCVTHGNVVINFLYCNKIISERLLHCIDYFIIYWFLQFTTVHATIFTNNFLFIKQLKQYNYWRVRRFLLIDFIS